MTAARSGFLVPRTRGTSSPAGWVHQSVAPATRPGAVTATVSVSDGTNDTTRLTRAGIATTAPVSSRAAGNTVTARAQRLRGSAGSARSGRPSPNAAARSRMAVSRSSLRLPSSSWSHCSYAAMATPSMA